MKDNYYNKLAYVDKMNHENSKIDTLTEEQHEAIQEINALRHTNHCNHNSYWCGNYIREYSDNVERIEELAKEIKDVVLNIDYDIEEIPVDDDYYLMDEVHDKYEDHDEFYKENYEKMDDMLESVNKAIENWLREIDEKYGTHYCPTGIGRFIRNETYNPFGG